ncbi:ECF transporter S component [Isachenkonia alkalipeptolytica]|uniref:ECF transporter S component n=1 Tax=Isachenkonia alkalipeptolytica TaxID=2565777 RepID=A0AA43XP27_9CLOT|nr:ECF transporter S component [Isachenkonia alkalipeptolytica]NBG89709.1 ECF transporter S component [Isachenkonia alkalipeptolytica]
MKNQTQNLVLTGLLMALVTVGTMIISIPVPATHGYVHGGDMMIFLAAVLFGKKKGALAGGVGSAIADLLLGYSQWIIPTLIVKGIMGYVIGSLSNGGTKPILTTRNIMAMTVGVLWMTFGYYIAGGIMLGSFTAALAGVPGDLLQSGVGMVLFVPICIALKRTVFKRGVYLN